MNNILFRHTVSFSIVSSIKVFFLVETLSFIISIYGYSTFWYIFHILAKLQPFQQLGKDISVVDFLKNLFWIAKKLNFMTFPPWLFGFSISCYPVPWSECFIIPLNHSDVTSFSSLYVTVYSARSVQVVLSFNVQDPSGFFIHPSGADHNIKEYLNILRKVYGNKQGKQFRVWVDNVLATLISSDTWLVKFDKWELHGMSLLCILLLLCSFHFPLLYISIKQFDILLCVDHCYT